MPLRSAPDSDPVINDTDQDYDAVRQSSPEKRRRGNTPPNNKLTPPKQKPQSPPKTQSPGSDRRLLVERLSTFYSSYYPIDDVLQWLSYSETETPENLDRREFCFTTSSDRFDRYKSFPTREAYLKAATQRPQDPPIKIDIGPVYDRSILERKQRKLLPLSRELVFDIDLTDYDDIRTCCTDKAICTKCWQYMNISVFVLNKLLRESFGFRQLLFVFSGRRGIHCWVCDKRARVLTDSERYSISSFISLLYGDYYSPKPPASMNFTPPSYPQSMGTLPQKSHNELDLADLNSPRLWMSYELPPTLKALYLFTLEPFFENILLPAQEWFIKPKYWKRILIQFSPTAKFRDEIIAEWEKQDAYLVGESSQRPKELPDEDESLNEFRWEQLKGTIQGINRQLPTNPTPAQIPRVNAFKYFIQSLILTLSWPRLDFDVSTHRNHLLKSPFCIHPSTTNLCHVINVPDAFTWDPLKNVKSESPTNIKSESPTKSESNSSEFAHLKSWIKFSAEEAALAEEDGEKRVEIIIQRCEAISKIFDPTNVVTLQDIWDDRMEKGNDYPLKGCLAQPLADFRQFVANLKE